MEVKDCTFHEFDPSTQERVDKTVAAAVAAERERWLAALAPVLAATEGELPHTLYELRGFINSSRTATPPA